MTIGSAARKGCAVAAQPSAKATITAPSYLRAAEVADILHVSPGGVPPMVEKRADAGSWDGILCGRHDRLVDHLLLEW
jgi:hypothetical protein